MSKEIATFAPVRVTIEFELSDGHQIAQASFGCGLGEIPTEAQVEQAALSVLEQVRAQLGDQFFFSGRHAFVGNEMAERTGGMKFAVPGPDQWEAAWANGSSSHD